MSENRTGRLVLLGLAVVVVALAGGVGFVVGANAAAAGTSVDVLGLVALPASPVAVGLYGAGVAAAVVGTLLGGMELAGRLEGR